MISINKNGFFFNLTLLFWQIQIQAQDQIPLLFPHLVRLYNPAAVAIEEGRNLTLYYREQYPEVDFFYRYLGYEHRLDDKRGMEISGVHRHVGTHDLYQLQSLYRHTIKLKDKYELSFGGQLDLNRAESIQTRKDGK